MVSHSQLMVKAALLRQVVTSSEEEIHAGHWQAAAVDVEKALQRVDELRLDLAKVLRVEDAMARQKK